MPRKNLPPMKKNKTAETWLLLRWSFKRLYLRAGWCLPGDGEGERGGISQTVQSFSYARGVNPRELLRSLVPVVNNAVLYSNICYESKSYVEIK